MTTATNISAFRTRTKPQLLVEAPVDTRTPLMRKLDVIQAMSERPLVKPVSEEPRDWKHWRKAENVNLKRQLRDRCRICNGTGEITVDDGSGGVDFDLCPRCGYIEPGSESYYDPIAF